MSWILGLTSLLASLSAFATYPTTDLRKHDATISLAPIQECWVSVPVADGLSKVQAAVKLQGKVLQVNECKSDLVRVTLVDSSGGPLKGKQKARQTKYLHRVMLREGFVEEPNRAWRLSR